MHPELRSVFDFLEQRFPGDTFAIHGSAVRSYADAHDIDVLLCDQAAYVRITRDLQSPYSGWDRGDVHLRRTVRPYWIPGVSKHVQFGISTAVARLEDAPFCVLLSDDTLLNEGLFYEKPRRDSAV